MQHQQSVSSSSPPQNQTQQHGGGSGQPAPQNAATAGPAGRRFHIAHRRSPSEYTPLMLEQYALQQQIEALQAQQQALASQLQPQQFLMQPQSYPVPVQQFGQFYPSPPSVQQPHTDLHRQPSGGHGRNRSMHGQNNMPPPPAPSSGSNTHVFDTFPGQINPPNVNSSPSRRGGHSGGGGGGHVRRHSLALTEAKERAAARQQANAAHNSGAAVPPGPSSPGADTAGLRSEYTGSTSSFTSPPTLVPSSIRGGMSSRGHGRSQSAAVSQNRAASPQRTYQFPPNQGEIQQQQSGGLERRGSSGSGHQRSGSRSDSNWRQPQDSQQGGLGASQHAPAQSFSGQSSYGHRPRGSMGGGSFSGFPQGMPGGLSINPIYAQQGGGLPPILSPQLMQQQQLVQLQLQQQQQQRKSLFAPYLPQGQLPGLLQEGKLVSGILRVNKKNRSDAYVSTDLLESDIFICGSKDRNRALEGDLVAVELLDVDEVWTQKREKEEKKKRKGDDTNAVGGLKRQGSIRIREGGKRKDDVEVEGQGLLLDVDEEEEVGEGQGDGKPMYAGHVVAVMERVGGQLFSGTLGLLRPSSAATKEKQEQERLARGESASAQPQYHRQQDKPKIVWFKPTDKRVPLIAIPTEQAPKDFVENHANYSNSLFVAAIKRWPITSLHPFGTLIEELGNMGDVEVESEAILRDNNITNEKFSDNLLASIADDDSIVTQAISEDNERRDFRSANTFTIDPSTVREIDDAISLVRSSDGKTAELGVHIADVSYFVRPNTLIDREARKRATSVYLVQRAVGMLPEKLSSICSLEPGRDRLAISVVFNISLEEGKLGTVNDVWMGRSVIQSKAKLSYDFVQKVIDGEKRKLTAEEAGSIPPQELVKDILLLHRITSSFRASRFDSGALTISTSPLKIEFALDDERANVTGSSVYESTPAMQLVEELMLKTNIAVAERIRSAWGGEGAFLRRHDAPIERRLEGFLRRCSRLGIDMDIGEDGRGIMKNLLAVSDYEIRAALEMLLVKSMQRAKYFVAGKFPEDQYLHYALNVPLYTHFTSPIRRYADIIVHRQLQSALANESTPPEESQSLIKLAENCNFKKEAARTAQEQSTHLFLCRMLRDMTTTQGPVTRCGIVVSVQSSSFDVVIPEFGIEKRVHLDQLPLIKAEFDRSNRVLELFWEKGVDSVSYNPEEVKPRQRTTTTGSFISNGKSHWRSDSQAEDELNLAVSSMGLEDNMALFDAPVSETAPTKAPRVPSIQTNTSTTTTSSFQASQSAPTSPVHPPADSNTWIPGLTSESGRTASLMNVTIGESNGRPSTSGTEKEPVEELREEEGVQVIRELCRVWVVIRAEVAGEGKSGGSLIFFKAMNPFP